MRLGVLLAVLTIPSGGAVYAIWNGAGGTGAGSGAAGTAAAVTLTPGTPAATLRPGGQAAVVLTAANANPFAVQIGSLALDVSRGTGGFAVDAGHSGCVLSTLSFASQTNGGAGWTVPARVGAVDGTVAITVANAVAMGLDAANACQGASATVYLVAGS